MVDYEVRGRVALLTINRPEARNAMDPESADALTRAFLDFAAFFFPRFFIPKEASWLAR